VDIHEKYCEAHALPHIASQQSAQEATEQDPVSHNNDR
jgi:hypothetical protein